MRFPPVLVFIGGLLLGFYFDTRLPFDIDGTGAGIVQTTAGGALGIAGLVVMLWAIRTLLFARTTIMPHHAARALVTSGPFRLSRNPIYLGLVFMYLGVAVVMNDAWPLVLLPAVLLIMSSLVIAREEVHLTEAFGDAYRAYCARVRRWI